MDSKLEFHKRFLTTGSRVLAESHANLEPLAVLWDGGYRPLPLPNTYAPFHG